MNEKIIIKEYKPTSMTNSYFIVGWGLFMIITVGYGIIKMLLDGTYFYWGPIIVWLIGTPIVYQLAFKSRFFNSWFIHLTEDSIIGFNGFKHKVCEIMYDRIDEIFNEVNIYNLNIQSIDGDKIRINLVIENPADFLNEIIKRSVNLRVLAIGTLEKEFPEVIEYERNFDLPHYLAKDLRKAAKQRKKF